MQADLRRKNLYKEFSRSSTVRLSVGLGREKFASWRSNRVGNRAEKRVFPAAELPFTRAILVMTPTCMPGSCSAVLAILKHLPSLSSPGIGCVETPRFALLPLALPPPFLPQPRGTVKQKQTISAKIMSRRNQRGNGVRGPNSALTEFLKSRGINASEIRRRAEERAAAAEAEAEGLDTASSAPAAAEASVTPANRRTRRTVAEESEAGPSTAPASTGKKTKKRKKGGDDDDGWNPYSKPIPVPGQIGFCAECNCRFTVTAYSRNGPDGDGLLCNPCGAKDAKTQKVDKKKRVQVKKVKKNTAQLLLDGSNGGPKSLRELCINLVAKHIDDVEALGDIGSMNMDLICQIIARNRRLNSNTMKLFLDPGSTRLNIYDCSKVDANELQSIAAVVPTLRHLSLAFCGNITDSVMDYYAEKLTSLTSLHLGGPFLVTKACYDRFFKLVGPRLTNLVLTDTARVNADVISSLVDNCPNLVELRLADLNRFDDECVRLLTGLGKLEILEISNPGKEVTDEAIIDVLNAVGSGLKELDLTRCVGLTDVVLDAIHACCVRLQTLSLEDCDLLTDEGITSLFTNWSENHGLSRANFSRVINFSDDALSALLKHSGTNLEILNLNSCGKLTEEGLQTLLMKGGDKMGRLEEIDLGFVRSVDDMVVEGLAKRCTDLKLVKVWGVPRMTQMMDVPREVAVIGREADLL